MPDTFKKTMDAVRRGRPIIITDRQDREGEADLFIPAVHATAEIINFMITEGRGLVCLPMTAERAQQLNLPLMVPPERNEEAHRCNFTVSVDARNGIGTGISAADRATTIRLLADPKTNAEDLVRPGHVFPLVAAAGGLAERDGHTEAAVRLCELAQLPYVGVICELINADGTMMRGSAIATFAARHQLMTLAISDIPQSADAPSAVSPSVSAIARARLPTEFGEFTIHIFRSNDGKEHAVLTLGDVTTDVPVLTRLHSQCLTGDTFHSLKCDCHEQLNAALRSIAQTGRGVLVYLNQEGRGIGLGNKIRAYALQEQGLDTVEANLALGFDADLRDYRVAADILHALGVRTISLLTNNPEKVNQLTQRGIAIVERRPLVTMSNGVNRAYLRAKAAKLGHQLNLE